MIVYKTYVICYISDIETIIVVDFKYSYFPLIRDKSEFNERGLNGILLFANVLL